MGFLEEWFPDVRVEDLMRPFFCVSAYFIRLLQSEHGRSIKSGVKPAPLNEISDQKEVTVPDAKARLAWPALPFSGLESSPVAVTRKKWGD